STGFTTDSLEDLCKIGPRGVTSTAQALCRPVLPTPLADIGGSRRRGIPLLLTVPQNGPQSAPPKEGLQNVSAEPDAGVLLHSSYPGKSFPPTTAWPRSSSEPGFFDGSASY